jgi:tetratricopeptide (TPR) repeat protein
MALWSAEIKELERLLESFKGQLPDLEKELERLVKADDENMILLYSRRCLEVIITDLCECQLKRERGTEPLKGIIDKLNKEKKVPSHIITSMHGLNELSTYGTHPKDFDPEQVKPVLNNLDIIIKWYLKYKDTKIKIQTEEKNQVKKELFEEVKKEEEIEQHEIPVWLTKHRFLSGVLITTILVVAGIIAYPKIFKKDTLEKLRTSGERISVAVMPFQNMTNDTLWNVWQNGIQTNLITSLSNYPEELKVRQTESITSILQSKGLTNYASITPAIASKISQKLDANVFIYGNINQAGTTIRVNAQLIDSKTQDAFKSFQMDGTAENILHMIDSLSVMIKDYLIISELKKDLSRDVQQFATTSSPEAFKYYIYGNNSFATRDFATATGWYLQALNIDSAFVDAALTLSITYWNQGLFMEGERWCRRIYEKRAQMPMQQKIMTNIIYTVYFEPLSEGIKYCRQLLEIDDQQPIIYYQLGWIYSSLYQYDQAIPEYEKALEIYNKWGSKPMWVPNYTALGYAYHKTAQYKKEKELYKKAERDFPDDPAIIYRLAVLSLSEGKIKDSDHYIEKYKSIRKENSAPEVRIMDGVAGIYYEANILDKAEEYYRKALSLEPDNPDRLNALAYFLIDSDRKINEGLELIDKALKISPNDYLMIDTRGWGLYKQRKYQEALDVLQKSWDLKPFYDHEVYLHLDAAKKGCCQSKEDRPIGTTKWKISNYLETLYQKVPVDSGDFLFLLINV